MDHRRQLEPGQSVQVTVLAGQEAASLGTIAASSNKNIDLLTETPVRPGCAIKLTGDGMLFLGEVLSCRPWEAGFAIGVELRHALYNTAELERLARRILEEDGRR
jgi:hypothetical protein